MTLNQPLLDDVQSVLEGKGFLVGGSVRDHLLDRDAKDWDFCTPLTADEVEDLTRKAGKRPYLVGKKFGTVGFKSNGEMVEVTTFRAETYTPGSRKPEVAFVNDLKSDLSRRDLTVNALALDADNNLVDFFGGQQDLEDKVLRAVGDPNERFAEDPLRLLRVARFVAQLGFVPDQPLAEAFTERTGELLNVSRERWVQELDKLLMAKDAFRGLGFLHLSGLQQLLLPEMWDGHRWVQVMQKFEKLSADVDVDQRWALLLSELAPESAHQAKLNSLLAEGVALRLKFSKARLKAVTQ
jgi:tRNA nucleotidyltransferase/poly(A) polymerase